MRDACPFAVLFAWAERCLSFLLCFLHGRTDDRSIFLPANFHDGLLPVVRGKTQHGRRPSYLTSRNCPAPALCLLARKYQLCHGLGSGPLLPDDVEGMQLLGRVYRELGQWEQAQETLTAAYQRSPTPETAHEAALACLAWADQLDESDARRGAALETAHRLLSWTTENKAGYGPGWEGLGRVLWQLGKRSEAIAALRQALVINPQSATAHGWLAEYLLALGERDQARVELQQALDLDPAADRMVQLAGDLSYEDGDFPKAASWYRQLQTLRPIPEPVGERLARCCLEIGQPQGAVDLLASRKMLDTAPRLVLGRSLARLGRWDKARDVLRAADPASRTLELDYYLANAHAACAEYGDAERLFTPLLAHREWKDRVNRCLAHVRVLQGDYSQGAALYAACDGGLATAFDLGRVSLLRGDAESAKEHFEQALAIDPADERARFGSAWADLELGDSTTMGAVSSECDFYPDAIEALADRAFQAGRYVDALHGYELAAKTRRSVSTRMLARMAVANLQLRRFREALSPLVELHKRQPDREAIRFNLAICYYQAGREHFGKSQWEAARKQFAQAEKLLRPISPEQADGVQAWHLEAGYREAVRLLEVNVKSASNLRRACELLDAGCPAAPNELRWAFGAGIVHALKGDLIASVDYLARAQTLSPHHFPTRLALALSCQAVEQGSQARENLQELLSSFDKPAATGGEQTLAVAARFALAMSWAKDRHWPQAADTLVPLLQHPLIVKSQRITPTDVAQAAVAYYAAAGDKQRAGELAQQYLKGTRGLGDVLIGLMQAEVGDYEGAAATLARAYSQQQDRNVGRLLIGCLLASAAAAVRKGELDKAEHSVAQALRYDASHADAKRFKEALGFARSLARLDLNRLDAAITQCRGMLTGTGQDAPQLVRSLGVLYHRHACQSEGRAPSAETHWSTCLTFWRQYILTNDGFWSGFVSAYNAGRGRREQLKEDQVGVLRQALPAEMAGHHVEYAGDYLSRNDAKGLARHLKLIWDWKPDFTPADGFLLDRLPSGQLSDGVLNTLQGCLKNVRNPKAREVINKVIEGHKMKKAIPWFNEGCAAMNRALETLNLQAALFKAMAESGMGYLARDSMRSNVREALRAMRSARDLIKKAYDLVPSDPDFKKAYAWARTQIAEVEEAQRALG